MKRLLPPFPYFGGKSKIIDIVWKYLGQPKTYIEPFFGSGVVLLNRQNYKSTMKEIIVDIDGYVCNTWRAIKFNCESIIELVDWPTNHLDLTSRKIELLKKEDYLIKNLKNNPKFFDSELAAYWIWCVSNSIAIWTGINAIPQIICSRGIGKISQRNNIEQWLKKLSNRFRYVDVICGEWNSVLNGNWQEIKGDVGIFLDPPYGIENRSIVYKNDSKSLYKDVLQYCIKKGDNKKYKIVLCGYDEYNKLIDYGWKIIKWKNHGGYENNKKNKENRNKKREQIYISPYCEKSLNIKNFIK